MIAYVHAAYAICWLGEMIRACLIFTLVEDLLTLPARAFLGSFLLLPLSKILICSCHINFSLFILF